jgi:hypothetical protein
MELIIILGVLFLAVALMVTLLERYGKPMVEQQQSKYSKIIPILVFIMLAAALIKQLV